MELRIAICILVLLCAPALQADEPAPAAAAAVVAGPKPKEVPHPGDEAIDEAIHRGIEFLLADQNSDGSWGTAERTKDLNIYAPVPGAHEGFRAAVTAMCVMALIETADGRGVVDEEKV